MRLSTETIVIILASNCQNQNTVDTDPIDITVSYDAGQGDSDGACEMAYTTEGTNVYDPYPGNNTDYPMMAVSDFPMAFEGDDFESYGHNDVIGTSGSAPSHIDITSGTLYAKHLNGSQVWKRGFTATHNFRMLSIGTYDGMPIRYTDGTTSVRVYFDAVHANHPHYTGAHIFGRYQTENDLYVASLRLDGQVMIKKKICGQYQTLSAQPFSAGAVTTDTWYEMSFEVVGNNLSLYINGQLEVNATDNDLSWGSSGVRLDYTDVYIDDWTFTP